MYKTDYVFRMNVMEEITEIRSLYRNFGQLYQNLHNLSVYVIQLIKNYNVYILWDLHPFKKKEWVRYVWPMLRRS